MDYQQILEQAKQHLSSFFNSPKTPNLLYHGFLHTKAVAAASTQIAHHYRLGDKDFFIVSIAGWFHDIGYFTDVAHHESKSAEIAEAFLKERNVDQETIDAVKKCILATKMPQKPVTLLEQITCDADLFHLGTNRFSERNKLLRKEREVLQDKKISKDEWRNSTIQFLEEHRYHTDYCRSLLDSKKKENLEKLRHKLANKLAQGTDTVIPALINEIQQKKNEVKESEKPTKPAKKKIDRPDRGIETMFRIGSGNNQKLSDMADTKAHIMISVNSIIISVLLTILLRKLEEFPNLIIPAILLLTVSLVTIIFSILATRPNVPKGTFSETDIAEKKVNLLFFGNYFRMDFDQYETGMLEVMDDRAFLYGTLIRDVYSQGVVLGKKFRMLKTSYNVFMYGLIASVIAFVIASFFN